MTQNPAGESEGEHVEAERKVPPSSRAAPAASSILPRRFIVVASVVHHGPDGDWEVASRSVIVDEIVDGNFDAKRYFEDWVEAQLDFEPDVPDDPWEEGGF